MTYSTSGHMDKICWIIRPILDNCYTETIPKMEVYVCTITDPKSTAKLISFLNSKFPDKSLLHLKRVHKISHDLKLIITTQDSLLNEIIEYLKSEQLFELIETPYKITVPSKGAKTRKQFDEAMKLWPLANFCADKYLEKTLNDKLFSIEEKVELEKMMKIALKAADKSKNLGGKGIGTVIAYKGKILAIGCDARNLHPLKHATMAALDMIAWIKQYKSYPAPVWLGNDVNEYDTEVTTSPEAYLCTDYDVFQTREPCMMCAMALLHNRVKRIFFGCSYVNGALESVVKLHTLPDINHRYQVFGGVLDQQCRDMLASTLQTSLINHACFS